MERDPILPQFALALLSREHVLMTGPPGTGKSQLVSAVLRRIIDEDTGAPSVYARQFTENTVQTDLIGPIDFKTLMESGRTEHFTEEGILGAVHAFLDEVFDGRDMLLRSTLNLLHERELKQGSSTRAGRIECAIMTSNRYIAEILESSPRDAAGVRRPRRVRQLRAARLRGSGEPGPGRAPSWRRARTPPAERAAVAPGR